MTLEWTQDAEVEIKIPRALRFIGDSIYVASDNKELFLLNQDFTEKQVIFENVEDKTARLVTFNNILCAYFEGSKEILKFKGDKKLQSLEVSDLIGDSCQMSSSDILLVSGNKGFAIFDK